MTLTFRSIPPFWRLALEIAAALIIWTVFVYGEGQRAGKADAQLAQDAAQVTTDTKQRDAALVAANTSVAAAERTVEKTRRAHDRAQIVDPTHVAITVEPHSSESPKSPILKNGEPAAETRVVEVPVEVTARMFADSIALVAQDSAIQKLQVVVVADAKLIIDLRAHVADLEHIKRPKLVGASSLVTGALGGAAVGAVLGGGIGAAIGAPVGGLVGVLVYDVLGRRR